MPATFIVLVFADSGPFLVHISNTADSSSLSYLLNFALETTYLVDRGDHIPVFDQFGRRFSQAIQAQARVVFIDLFQVFAGFPTAAATVKSRIICSSYYATHVTVSESMI
jgi:hypothetical protein